MKAMKRIFSIIFTVALLAAFAAGVFAVPQLALVQNGSWQQHEFLWQGNAEHLVWQIDVLQGDAMTHEAVFGDIHVLSLRTMPETNTFVRVVLVVDGIASQASYVWLLCDAQLQVVLTQAQTIAQNPNGRYCPAYIAQLQAVISTAQAFYTTQEIITPDHFTAMVEQLSLLCSNPVLAQNSGLFRRLAPAWWRMVDAVTSPLRSLQNHGRTGVFMPVVGRVISAVFA